MNMHEPECVAKDDGRVCLMFVASGCTICTLVDIIQMFTHGVEAIKT